MRKHRSCATCGEAFKRRLDCELVRILIKVKETGARFRIPHADSVRMEREAHALVMVDRLRDMCDAGSLPD